MLATILASVVSGEATEAIGRARRTAVAYLIAGLFAFCGAVFLLVAGYIAAARELGPLPAALWFGGGFVLLAVLVIVIHSISTSVRKRRIAKRRETEMKAVASAAAIAMLPVVASRVGGLGLVVPAVAALAWAVYRENKSRKPGDTDPR
nr:hypothetical protein [Mesorhizobium microcysteis]